MKVFLSHSSSYDFEKDLYQPIKEAGLNIILPHETSGFINSKSIIKSCDLIIAEISEASTGLGIELGWASDFDKKIVCIYKSGSKFSESLKTVCNNFIEYNNKEELVKIIKNKISN